MSSAAKQLQRYTKYQYAVIFLRLFKIIILAIQFKCFIIKKLIAKVMVILLNRVYCKLSIYDKTP